MMLTWLKHRQENGDILIIPQNLSGRRVTLEGHRFSTALLTHWEVGTREANGVHYLLNWITKTTCYSNLK